MTGYERTMAFLRGETVDRPPFHPIIMRWAAGVTGTKYRDFCVDPASKCRAMIQCAREYDLDWVTVMSDPWAEASAFGVEIQYPEDDLPHVGGGLLPDAASAASLKPYDPALSGRCKSRLEEIDIYKACVGAEYFITGWVEGPVAAYANIRGTTEASMDLLLEPEQVDRAMDLITECAMRFIRLQIERGAHAIGIGDAFCSQIGPDLYRQYAWERHRELVRHIHACGAVAKLHICGNTASILPDMISTDADIVDVDHLVPDMSAFTGQLAPGQVFCGKSDPVSVVQDGDQETIFSSVRRDREEADGRCIVSAGCEITPGTSLQNMKYFRKAAATL